MEKPFPPLGIAAVFPRELKALGRGLQELKFRFHEQKQGLPIFVWGPTQESQEILNAFQWHNGIWPLSPESETRKEQLSQIYQICTPVAVLEMSKGHPLIDWRIDLTFLNENDFSSLPDLHMTHNLPEEYMVVHFPSIEQASEQVSLSPNPVAVYQSFLRKSSSLWQIPVVLIEQNKENYFPVVSSCIDLRGQLSPLEILAIVSRATITIDVGGWYASLARAWKRRAIFLSSEITEETIVDLGYYKELPQELTMHPAWFAEHINLALGSTLPFSLEDFTVFESLAASPTLPQGNILWVGPVMGDIFQRMARGNAKRGQHEVIVLEHNFLEGNISPEVAEAARNFGNIVVISSRQQQPQYIPPFIGGKPYRILVYYRSKYADNFDAEMTSILEAIVPSGCLIIGNTNFPDPAILWQLARNTKQFGSRIIRQITCVESYNIGLLSVHKAD